MTNQLFIPGFPRPRGRPKTSKLSRKEQVRRAALRYRAKLKRQRRGYVTVVLSSEALAKLDAICRDGKKMCDVVEAAILAYKG